MFTSCVLCGHFEYNKPIFFDNFFFGLPLGFGILNPKKASRIEENDYGEESEMFLELIFTTNEKGKSKHFDQAVLFPPPYS